jgi:hypothetical protein
MEHKNAVLKGNAQNFPVNNYVTRVETNMPQCRHATFKYNKFLMTYTVKAVLHRIQL